VIILGAFLNFSISKCSVRRQRIVERARDEKLNSITELIQHIKMIKLYSWIDQFVSKCQTTRANEINAQYKRMTFNMANQFVNLALPGILIIG